MAGYKSKKMLTDRQPQATDDEQDDLTLVYMWAFEKGEESAKVRIEQLTSGPGGIMEMKQTIADKEREIEYLQADLRFWQERYTHYTTTLQAEVDRLQKELDLADTVVHNLKWAEKFYPDIFDETLAKLFGHEEKK